MKKGIKRILFLCILLVFGILDGKDTNKERLLTSMVIKTLERWHFSPLPLDDEFSKRAFGLLLKRLDYSKRFFIQPDLTGHDKSYTLFGIVCFSFKG